MNKPVKATLFILKKIVIIALVALLCVAGFLMCMNASNFYVLLNDGFKERADVIIYGDETDEMSKYFTGYYMSSDSYTEIAKVYEMYRVYSYGYKLNIHSVIAWPWTNRTEIYIDEAVYSIDGEINTAYMSKEDAKEQGVFNPPTWKNATYKVVLVKQDGRWYIDEMIYIRDFSYEPPTQRTVEPEVLASLRATATPTETPAPTSSNTQGTTGSAPAVTEDNATYGVVKLNGSFSSLNVRKGAGSHYDVVGTLVEDEKVKILATEGAWYKIEYENGKIGYASSKYIKIN